MKQTQYDKLIDALNFIDEIAEHASQDYDEDKQRAKAYKIVADFIDKNAKR
jgi:hypothetical protein